MWRVASASAAAGSPFGGLEAGLSFFQDWMKAAGSALPNLQAAQGTANSGTWGMPTLDPEELDEPEHATEPETHETPVMQILRVETANALALR